MSHVIIKAFSNEDQWNAERTEKTKVTTYQSHANGREDIYEDILEWKCPKCNQLVGMEVGFACNCGIVHDVDYREPDDVGREYMARRVAMVLRRKSL